MNNSMGNELKNNNLFAAAAFFALTVGVIFGSVYLTRVASASGEDIRTYLERFIQSGAEADRFTVFKKAFRENLISLAVVFAAGFFKFGILLTAASVVRRGFIMGFTTASLIKYYGTRGFFAMAATMPSVLIMLPAFLVFAAVSACVSMSENKKQLMSGYIILALFMLAVFAAAALSEGYLTTSFMGLIFTNTTQ